jgi:serine O-acetyltransferase
MTKGRMLKLAMTTDELVEYVGRQLNHVFPDGRVSTRQLRPHVEKALERIERCFSAIKMKYYFDGVHACFSHLHTDQYAAFLYFLGNSIYRNGGNLAIAAKVYALNKALHAVDVLYEVQLPELFLFEHPLGTVLGRATYANYFVVYQHCTVGSNLAGVYPTLGEGVVMYAGSAIIGRCTVGANCWVSAGTRVMDTDLPSNTIAFGQAPHPVIKPTKRRVPRDIFARENSLKLIRGIRESSPTLRGAASEEASA